MIKYWEHSQWISYLQLLVRLDKQRHKNPLHWIMLCKWKIDFPSICEQYNATCSVALFTNGSFILFFLQAKKAKKTESGRNALLFSFSPSLHLFPFPFLLSRFFLSSLRISLRIICVCWALLNFPHLLSLSLEFLTPVFLFQFPRVNVGSSNGGSGVNICFLRYL